MIQILIPVVIVILTTITQTSEIAAKKEQLTVEVVQTTQMNAKVARALTTIKLNMGVVQSIIPIAESVIKILLTSVLSANLAIKFQSLDIVATLHF